MGSIADYSATVWLTDKKGNIKEELCSVSNDIYCIDFEDDEVNKTTDEFIVTQKFIDSLKPGDKICLQGDGDSY